MAPEHKIIDLGLVEFSKAFLAQKEFFNEIKTGSLKSVLVFCRHYPVITYGRGVKSGNLKADELVLSGRGIKIYPADRGGDVTYHGPGQLVVYPIFNLEFFKKDLHYFLRFLEKTVIAVLSEFGINGSIREGLTGVWVERKKISSIGITVKKWISYHGLALNVKNEDLDNFSLIRPCGMDIEMTSMETILKKAISFEDIKKSFIRRFGYA
ncbi:MAG: lipoyl(octanoyl) transferase LipB [Candidatus Omnitrophota bacterium]